MKRIFKKITLTATVLLAVCFTAVGAFSLTLPSEFLVTRGQELTLNHTAVSCTRQTDPAEAVGRIQNDPVQYTTRLKLFGMIPIKDVAVRVVDRPTLTVCGTPFGIKMFTKGVMVVAVGNVDCGGESLSPASMAGIEVGDILLKLGGEELKSNKQIAECIAASGGAPQALLVQRGDKTFSTTLTPLKSDLDGSYKAGIWVRDSSAGIGTATFYDQATGLFAGLGHAICDVDTGEQLPLGSGEIVDVSILGITKGKSGTPGELIGTFASRKGFGTLYANSSAGVFGHADRSPVTGAPIPLALKQEIRTGKATLYTTLDNNMVEAFEVEIEKINLSADNPTKNMIIKVTDPKLIERTGGIVQGMSGSPIVQNGQLVAAVTHVFINDPTKGFAIFAENMYTTMHTLLGEVA